MSSNAIIVQSGGPTAVVNCSLFGLLEEARRLNAFSAVFGARYGIAGLLREQIIDLGREPDATVKGLRSTPSAALGSCRYTLQPGDYWKLLAVFRKYSVESLFIIGGNDSMATAASIDAFMGDNGYRLQTIGIPKTIDNDLPVTDHCPGYGSALKFLAALVKETETDTVAMAGIEPVTVIETMGRDAGWLAAGTALCRQHSGDAPHLIIVPEAAFDRNRFTERVRFWLDSIKRCTIVVAEGARDADSNPLRSSQTKFESDMFGNRQLGEVGYLLRDIIETDIGVKTRVVVPSTAQRVAAHAVSGRDAAEAEEAGRHAVRSAVRGESGKMVTLLRSSDEGYDIRYGMVGLAEVAGKVKKIPREWILPGDYYVTDELNDYARPLVQGRTSVRMQGGIVQFVRLNNYQVTI